MLKTETVRARIAPDLKSSAETIFESLGLNVSQAITLFYRQVELRNGLPFEVSLNIPNATTRRSIEKTEQAEDLTVCGDAAEMFAKLGI